MGNSQPQAAPPPRPRQRNDSDSSKKSSSSSSDPDVGDLLMGIARLLAAQAEAKKNAGNGATGGRGGDADDNTPQRMVTENETLHSLYEEKSYLGQGAFGVVVKGRHYLDRSFYAIKVIGFDRPQLQHVVREVRALSSLPTHPHIVAYKGCWLESTDKIKDPGLIERLKKVGREGSLPDLMLCVRLECCTCNLDDHMGQRNSLFFREEKYRSRDNLRDGRSFSESSYRTQKAIFYDILKGLMFLHERRIIHRDLKPANILLDKETNDFKITDFGLAKHIESSQAYMTQCGTLMYAAPEQILMKNYDQTADIFSLGLILFEILYPISSGSEFQTLFRNLRARKELPEGLMRLHRQLSLMILKMVSDEPDRRPSLEQLQALDWKNI